MLAAMTGTSAWADEPSPYYIGASVGFTHDSNVYRVPDGVGDTYWSTGLLGGFDQSIGRQRVYAAANVAYNKYQDQTALNNTSYGVNAGWDWATIDQLTGRVFGSANQSLAAYNNNAAIPLTARNLVKADQIGTSVRWGGEGLLSLEGGYAHSRVRYSAPEYQSGQSSADTANAGVFYAVGPSTKVGLGVRFTRTRSPYGQVLPSGELGETTSNGRNIDLTLDWRATDKSYVNARVSFTHQTNPGGGADDFSGITGAIAASYAATGKITLNASAAHDVGSNAQFFNYVVPPTDNSTTVTTATGLLQNSRTTDTVNLGANYAATAKIAVNAGWQYSRGRLVNTVLGSSGNEYNDNTRSATLGVAYAFTRNIQFGCNYQHLTRDVSGSSGFSYDANVAGCTAQVTLR